jgi:hypothetical protein
MEVPGTTSKKKESLITMKALLQWQKYVFKNLMPTGEKAQFLNVLRFRTT